MIIDTIAAISTPRGVGGVAVCALVEVEFRYKGVEFELGELAVKPWLIEAAIAYILERYSYGRACVYLRQSAR